MFIKYRQRKREDILSAILEIIKKFKNISILINSPEIINVFSNQLKTHAFLKKKTFLFQIFV